MNVESNCPCGSGREFGRCCGPFISQSAVAENATQLMRSRYSAYVIGASDYLAASWHRDYRPADIAPDPALRWLGLEIIAADEQGERARVEFEARWLGGGRVDALHERGEFVREAGRWYYTRGEILPPSFVPWKPARNEVCPCGSGRKFKRCCGRRAWPGSLSPVRSPGRGPGRPGGSRA